MFRNVFTLILAALLLQACSTVYTPKEYSFDTDSIPAFALKGNLTITGSQTSTDTIEVYKYGPTSISSNLKVINEMFVRQANAEQAKRARKQAGSDKSIDIKVASISSVAAFYHFNSSMVFQVKLGSGVIINKTVEHSSAGVQSDLDGCIADGVMALFKDVKVQDYLAQ